MGFTKFLNDHPGTALSFVIFVIAQAGIVARSVWLAAQTEKKVEKMAEQLEEVEKLFLDHVQSSNLHRTPDFEVRLADLGRTLEEIRADIKQLLKKEK
jgi:hypothetical protein